ncbi:MAG: M1 family aminopeptidase [Vicinamibacteria bacterium]
MRRFLPAVALVLGVAAAAPAQPAAPPAPAARVRHSMKVTLDPARGWLSVVDEVAVPGAAVKDGGVEFLLNRALKVTSAEPAVAEAPAGKDAAARFFGINSSPDDLYAAGKLKRYRAALPGAGGTVHLAYEGKFDFGLSDQKEEYTRGFRETEGIVSKDGVYLSGGGYWYPFVDRDLVDYEVEVAAPEGWHVIAAGNGTSRDAQGRARWESHGAIDEITLVGGPLVVYRDSAGAVESLVYLRQKDDSLAAKYLTATAQYLEMYRGLLGPYPYGKFAMVENFWETGYGMPSYTLLGPQIIRFPFILTSSYPHEILHNWWGNSAFVDYASGNWCEGLTAYMADHLIQEQRGKGDEYRRDTLQKYRSYVKDGRDFPLSEFRSRHSAATEAVGYGKTLMVFHMLRQRLGDDGFRRWAARFYRENRGKQASFADVRKSMEAVAGADLGAFFAAHVAKPGAARLRATLTDLRDAPNGGAAPAAHDGYDVAFVLEQTQDGEPRPLDVPVVVQTTGKPVASVVRMTGRLAATTLHTEAEPVALHVDPQFDVFRLLDPRETAPSIGQIFGEAKIVAVLPAGAPAAEQEGYRKLVESWRSDSHQPEIVTDAQMAEVPADRAVWLLGRTNALAAKLFASGGDYSLDARRTSRSTASRWRSAATRSSSCGGTRKPREGGRLDLRRRPRPAARPRAEAAALRKVLVPRLRGRRAGERAEGPVDRHGLADARRPEAGRGAAPRRDGARPAGPRRARRAAARLLAEGPPRSRAVARRPGARGPRRRHRRPRRGRRVRGRGVRASACGRAATGGRTSSRSRRRSRRPARRRRCAT